MGRFNTNGKATSNYTWKFSGSTNKVYPTGAGGVTVTANAAAWTLGSPATIVAANAIASAFMITGIAIEAVNGAGIYELVLYDDGVECGRKKFAILGTPGNQALYPIDFNTDEIAANSAITAKVMTSSTNADTVTLSIEYEVL
jgi:hypothetical protein